MEKPEIEHEMHFRVELENEEKQKFIISIYYFILFNNKPKLKHYITEEKIFKFPDYLMNKKNHRFNN